MGHARGIFMMDSHVSAQNLVNPDKDKGEILLYHMEKFGVDMCVLVNLVPCFNKKNADLVKKHPDKLIAICNDEQTQIKSASGQEKWTAKAAVKEVDGLLSEGLFKGIGIGIPRDRTARRELLP